MVPFVQSLTVVSITQVKNKLGHRYRHHWVPTSVQDSVWRLLAKDGHGCYKFPGLLIRKCGNRAVPLPDCEDLVRQFKNMVREDSGTNLTLSTHQLLLSESRNLGVEPVVVSRRKPVKVGHSW